MGLPPMVRAPIPQPKLGYPQHHWVTINVFSKISVAFLHIAATAARTDAAAAPEVHAQTMCYLHRSRWYAITNRHHL